MGITEQRRREIDTMWDTLKTMLQDKRAMKMAGYEVWDDETILEEREKWYAYEVYLENRRVNEMNRRVRQLQKEDGTIKTQIITLCIDKNVTEEIAVKAQQDIINSIKKSNSKWLINAKAVCEFYSKKKENPSGTIVFNPHIHIYIERSIKSSLIALQLRRKFVDKGKLKESHVYRVNVKDGQGNFQLDYINGTKIQEKSECVEKDRKFRQEHKIEEVIDI